MPARSCARRKTYWDKDWASSDMYIKFWEQTVEYALRPVDTGKFLQLTTELRDGKVRVIVEANDSDADKTPLTDVKLKAGVMSPTFKGPDSRKVEIEFEQKSAGVYEGEFPADEVGLLFPQHPGASWNKGGKEIVDNVRGGVTIPYSPEFAEMESNAALLEKISEITGGKMYEDDANIPARGRPVRRRLPHQSDQPAKPAASVVLAGRAGGRVLACWTWPRAGSPSNRPRPGPARRPVGQDSPPGGARDDHGVHRTPADAQGQGGRDHRKSKRRPSDSRPGEGTAHVRRSPMPRQRPAKPRRDAEKAAAAEEARRAKKPISPPG